MNWPINIESKDFFYQPLARKIADEIWESLSNGDKEHYSDHHWIYETRIHNDSRWVIVTYQIARYEDIEYDYDIWAGAGPNEMDEPSVNFTFIMQKGKHIKKHKIPYAELYATVAHELHHIAQNINEKGETFLSRIRGQLDPDRKLSYFLCPVEIEAFHIGLRAESYFTGEDFETITRRYLKNYVELTDENVNQIINAWLNPGFNIYNAEIDPESLLD